MGDSSDSSSPSSTEEKKKKEKKQVKKDKKKGKKDKKKKESKKDKNKKDKKKKATKKKDKKRKVSSSSSSSSSSSRKQKEKSKRKRDEEVAAQNSWIAVRLREIRLAEPTLEPRKAMKRAQEEWTAEQERLQNPPVPVQACCPLAIGSDGVNWPEKAAQAARDLADEMRAAGKSENEIEEAALEEGERVMRLAKQAGLYKEPAAIPLFMQARAMKDADDARRHVDLLNTGVPRA